MKLLLPLLLLAANAFADAPGIFANGFESPLIPTNCKSIASHTDGIRDFTRWTGTQAVNYTSGPTPRQADVTSFASVFQFGDKDWPGVNGVVPMMPIPTNKYVSLQFTVSGSYLGAYLVGQTGYSAPFSATLSLNCGDFSSPGAAGSTVLPGCYKNRMQAGGGIAWNTRGKGCVLPAGVVYLNLGNFDISTIGPGSTGYATSTQNDQCKAHACSDPVLNSWSGQ